jgi:hypothetical protein
MVILIAFGGIIVTLFTVDISMPHNNVRLCPRDFAAIVHSHWQAIIAFSGAAIVYRCIGVRTKNWQFLSG